MGAKKKIKNLPRKEREILLSLRERLGKGLKEGDYEKAFEISVEVFHLLFPKGKLKELYAFLSEVNDSLSKCAEETIYGRFLYYYARVATDLGYYDEAEEKAKKGFEILRKTSFNKELAFILYELGRLYIRMGRLQDALEWLNDSISSFRRIEEYRWVARAANLQAQVYQLKGMWKEAAQRLEMAIEIAQEYGKKEDVGFFLINLGTIQLLKGDWKGAEEAFKRGLSILQNLGNSLAVSRIYQALGLLEIYKRNWKLAEDYLERAKILAQEGNFPRELGISFEYLGDLAFSKGNYAEAFEYYEKVLEIAERIAPSGDFISQVERRRGELFLQLGKLEEAKKSIEKALEISKKLDDKYETAICYRILGLLMEKKGERTKAIGYLSRSDEILQNLDEKHERAKTLIELSRILSLGKEEETRKGLSFVMTAEELARKINSRWLVLKAKLVWARIMLKEEKAEAALEILTQVEKELVQRKEESLLREIIEIKEEAEKKILNSAHILTQSYLEAEKWKRKASLDLMEALLRIVKVTSSERGLISIKNKKNIEVKAWLGFSQEEAYEFSRKVLSDPTFGNMELPVIRVDYTVSSARISSLMARSFPMTFGKGILYVDRVKRKVPFSQDELTLFAIFSEAIAVRFRKFEDTYLVIESLETKKRLGEPVYYEGIVTRNPAMIEIIEMIEKLKDSDIPILIQGETGTGKELVARAIHARSKRKKALFVPLNCANIPESLLESELFGHKRGAFTGAVMDKKGWLEVAQGGTVFLDEITEMTERVQAKLLRFLEHKEITPLGSTTPIQIDVRIIAATNKNLYEEVKNKNFREDLYYRLKGITINLPPLRERREDIPILAEHFLRKYTRGLDKEIVGISDDAFEALLGYWWPGNVRELENEIRRAVVLVRDGEPIRKENFSFEIRKGDGSWQLPLNLFEKLSEYEKSEILKALEMANWVQTAAAKILGIPESTLRRKMKKHGISKAEFKN